MNQHQHGTHKHRCNSCGCVWEHANNLRGNVEAHTCPNPGCGDEQWNHYRGPLPATHTHKCAQSLHSYDVEILARDGRRTLRDVPARNRDQAARMVHKFTGCEIMSVNMVG